MFKFIYNKIGYQVGHDAEFSDFQWSTCIKQSLSHSKGDHLTQVWLYTYTNIFQ